MAEEYLYGITLDGEKNTETWDPEPKNDESDSNQQFGVDQKLIIKMVLLGPEAKPGELNVIQVEAMGLKGPVKVPIALLEMGKTSQIILDLSIPDPPVTFTLIKGTGPVHIVGHNLLEFEDMDEDEGEVDNYIDEDFEKDGEEEDEEEEDDEPKKKKNKPGAPLKNKNQVNKNQNQKKKVGIN